MAPYTKPVLLKAKSMQLDGEGYWAMVGLEWKFGHVFFPVLFESLSICLFVFAGLSIWPELAWRICLVSYILPCLILTGKANWLNRIFAVQKWQHQNTLASEQLIIPTNKRRELRMSVQTTCSECISRKQLLCQKCLIYKLKDTTLRKKQQIWRE